MISSIDTAPAGLNPETLARWSAPRRVRTKFGERMLRKARSVALLLHRGREPSSVGEWRTGGAPKKAVWFLVFAGGRIRLLQTPMKAVLLPDAGLNAEGRTPRRLVLIEDPCLVGSGFKELIRRNTSRALRGWLLESKPR
ncbi:hypothetical protein EG829_23615 [bacterium]|nr:hypothetical protein [bacterium]